MRWIVDSHPNRHCRFGLRCLNSSIRLAIPRLGTTFPLFSIGLCTHDAESLSSAASAISNSIFSSVLVTGAAGCKNVTYEFSMTKIYPERTFLRKPTVQTWLVSVGKWYCFIFIASYSNFLRHSTISIAAVSLRPCSILCACTLEYI